MPKNRQSEWPSWKGIAGIVAGAVVAAAGFLGVVLKLDHTIIDGNPMPPPKTGVKGGGPGDKPKDKAGNNLPEKPAEKEEKLEDFLKRIAGKIPGARCTHHKTPLVNVISIHYANNNAEIHPNIGVYLTDDGKAVNFSIFYSHTDPFPKENPQKVIMELTAKVLTPLEQNLNPLDYARFRREIGAGTIHYELNGHADLTLPNLPKAKPIDPDNVRKDKDKPGQQAPGM